MVSLPNPQSDMRFALVNDETTAATYVVGPEDYMKAQGCDLIYRILAGEDQIFNLTCTQAPDSYRALLAHLQTDYAGWVGFKQTERWLTG